MPTCCIWNGLDTRPTRMSGLAKSLQGPCESHSFTSGSSKSDLCISPMVHKSIAPTPSFWSNRHTRQQTAVPGLISIQEAVFPILPLPPNCYALIGPASSWSTLIRGRAPFQTLFLSLLSPSRLLTPPLPATFFKLITLSCSLVRPSMLQSHCLAWRS